MLENGAYSHGMNINLLADKPQYIIHQISKLNDINIFIWKMACFVYFHPWKVVLPFHMGYCFIS